MRTAEQMRATLQACHEAGDHSEALEVATDITVDAERRRAEHREPLRLQIVLARSRRKGPL